MKPESGPKIVIVFIYAHVAGADAKTRQFLDTYKQYPPGMDHHTLIVCNGCAANDDVKGLFSPLSNVSFLERDDSGWDIGGFQHAARVTPCDMMVFFGGHTYFRRQGWLLRMYESYCDFGDTLYGATGNQGDLRFNVHPHIRTTAFWCHPNLMNRYPILVTQGGPGGQRYEFEHGATCMTNWVRSQGREAWVVGWESAFPVTMCDSMPGGYHKENQQSVLVGDRLTAPPYWGVP